MYDVYLTDVLWLMHRGEGRQVETILDSGAPGNAYIYIYIYIYI